MVKSYGNYLVYDDGTIINSRNNRRISTSTLDRQGNIRINDPFGSTIRLDYLMVVLFLNDGVFFKRSRDCYIEHLDGDKKNCKLSNLKMYIDSETVNNKRYSYLKTSKKNIKYVLYVADKVELVIKEYTLPEFCRHFKISREAALRKAKEQAYVNKTSSRYIVCETYMDAYEWL